MNYLRFLSFNLIGGILWVTLFISVGILLWKYSNNKAELHISDIGYNSNFANPGDIGIFEAFQEKEMIS